ncbi:MAG: FMN-binding protein [Clostridiales bacterium]|nr:FMN-binding protein [Clostridiales bacterium]
MDIFLNFGLAWISVFLALFLTVAYLIRKAIIKFPKRRGFFIKLNKALRKYHKWIGAVLIITGVLHGIFSSEKLFSINWGTGLWVLSILLGITWMMRKKLTGKKNWMFFHRLLVVLFSISIVIHVIDVGGIHVFKIIKTTRQISAQVEITEPTKSPASSINVDAISESPTTTTDTAPTPTISIPDGNTYKDGTYTGEAVGYQPGLIVSVTIKDNIITSVEVTDHNEMNSKFWTSPVKYIPIWILEAQNTEVDTITGATFTSTGIINAVNDALRQALVSGSIPDDLSLPGSN